MNSNATNSPAPATTHRFETAGLGKGPFRHAGCFRAQELTSCHHCSTAIRIVHLIKSSDGNLFRVGSDCVEHLFDGHGHVVADARTARKTMLTREREQRNAEARRERARQRRLEQFRAARTTVADLDANVRAMLRQHRGLDIVQSFRARVATGTPLTERQVEVLQQIHARATLADRPQVEVPAGDERREVRGVLLSVKWVENRFSYSGDVCKVTVRVDTPEGSYKVYGTAPTGFFDAIIADNNDRFEAWRALPRDGKPVEAPEDWTLKQLIGQPVGFHARLQRSDRDPSFGFFSRPTKAWIKLPS